MTVFSGPYLTIFLGCFFGTLVLCPLFRRLALRYGIVDAPGAARKVHRDPVPYLGGAAFFICFLGTVAYVRWQYPEYMLGFLYPMAGIGALIFLMGLYDDMREVSSGKKLVAELVLTSLFFFWGLRSLEIETPFTGVLQLGSLSLLFTPLWITGIINAVNFSDGLDGLAAGLVFISAAAIFAISYTHQQVVSCVVMACLMGTTLAFLRYNWHPASMFMGDAGALFLGFILGATTLLARQKGVAIIALSVPAIVMAIPVLDTLLSFWRRLLRARRGEFFSPDRDHLHHRLLALGLRQDQVVLALLYISACMGMMALVFSVTPPPFNFLVLLAVVMSALFGVAVLRFLENLAARQQQAAAAPEHERR